MRQLGENSWEPLTNEQVEQTTSAVFAIMREFNIDADKVISHEEASAKTPGEGGVVKDAITIYPLAKPASAIDSSLPGRPVEEIIQQ